MKIYHYGHVKKISSDAEWAIFSCVTRAEACRLWDKWPKTVQNHIDTGRLVARRSEGTWLISVESLYRLWGKPPEPEHTTDLWWTWCKVDTIVRAESLQGSG